MKLVISNSLSARVRRSIAIGVAMTIGFPPALHANIQSQMQGVFDGMGQLGNVTAPGAFHSQAGNVITGGSLYVRTPQRGYPIANIQLPSVRAGCGGIDIYGGSFSFINKAQFTATLQNIGSAALGYAFQLALSSITPQISSELKDLMDKIQKMNNFAMDSCRTAQGLVNGALGQIQRAREASCQNNKVSDGSATDASDAIDQCTTDSENRAVADAGSADPNVRAKTPASGNLIWKALQKITTLTDEERELAMSFIGTVVFTPPSGGNAGSIETYAPTIKTARELMYGEDITQTNVITVKLLSCGGDADCMSPVTSSATVTPFREHVRVRLERLSQNIVNGVAPAAADVQWVNNTSIPVYKMLSVANMRRGMGLADTMIEKYRDVIAFDYVEVFIAQVLNSVTTAVMQGVQPSTVEEVMLRDFAQRLGAVKAGFAAERAAAESKVASIGVVEAHIREVERSLMATVPPALKMTLDYARNQSARR